MISARFARGVAGEIFSEVKGTFFARFDDTGAPVLWRGLWVLPVLPQPFLIGINPFETIDLAEAEANGMIALPVSSSVFCEWLYETSIGYTVTRFFCASWTICDGA